MSHVALPLPGPAGLQQMTMTTIMMAMIQAQNTELHDDVMSSHEFIWKKKEP